MTKLEQLINELCPDGVEYKTIGEVTSLSAGGDVPKNRFSKIRTVDFNVPIYSNGVGENALYGYTDIAKIIEESVTISARGTIGYCELRKGPYYPVVRLICAIPNQEIIAPFLKYVLETIEFKVPKTGIPQLTVPMVSKYKIPVPPLVVQGEIVRILDSFTELIAELTAELTARQKQYTYFCNKLFANIKNTEITTIDKLSKNYDYKRKPVTQGSRISGNIPYYGASGIVDYVKDYIFDGDYLLVSEDGANLIARNTPIAFSISGKTWVNNHAHILKFEKYVTRRYVEMYLNSIDLTPYITGAAQPKLNQNNLNKIEIPLPSFEEQQRIVSILDRFDKLCNDISEGLPAEIEARKKQYEYYRDKLLTFKEKTS